MVTVKVEFQMYEAKLMDDFMGCNWEQDSVAREFVKSYEEVGNKIHVIYWTAPNGGLGSRWVTAEDVAKGWAKAIEAGTHHCGEPIGLDSEDWDACVGTAILQFILFGEEVYA